MKNLLFSLVQELYTVVRRNLSLIKRQYNTLGNNIDDENKVTIQEKIRMLIYSPYHHGIKVVLVQIGKVI